VTWRSDLFGICILLLTFAGCTGQAAFAEPRASLEYKRDVIREARAVWGLDAPIALFAGQIEQESAWRPKVCSPFACGLAQFTPATADWISGAYPKELGDRDPFNPQWAIRALVTYNRRIFDTAVPSASECDRFGFTLSGYNGGPGWVTRDRRLCGSAAGCEPDRWFGHVEKHSRRAAWAMKENRDYPRRILYQRQFNYTKWGRTISCPEAYRTPGPSK
jgi:soluble lytic murein transglycosylase-like protein